MWSACGASPPGALASSAARWRTPKRCCSSTTQTARSRNSTAVLDQRVRAHEQRQLAGGQPLEQVAPAGGRGGAGEQRDRHSTAQQPVERARGAARPASRWAPSARPGAPFSTARSIACSATTVLPEPDLAHQQALHRALARRGRRRSRSQARLLVAGQLERERGRASGSTSSPVAASGARAAALAARAAPRADTASWSRNSSSNASRRRAPSLVALAARGSGPPASGRRRGRAAARRPAAHAGSGSTTSADALARVPDELAQPRRRQALGAGIDRARGRAVCTGAPPPPRSARTRSTQNSFALLHAPVEQHAACRRASLSRHPGLVEPDGHAAGPISSATRASTRLTRRRLRIGRTDTRARARRRWRPPPPPRRRSAGAPRAVAVAVRQVLDQVAHGLDAERRGRLRAPARAARAARPSGSGGAASAARPAERRRASAQWCRQSGSGTASLIVRQADATRRRAATTRPAGRRSW